MILNDREIELTRGLNLNNKGIEVSPLYRPTVRKEGCNVFYTDYCSAEESRKKHSGYDHDEIMEIDFIWHPGKMLRDCIPDDFRFDWAISSHVLEHVPNPIGWTLEVLEVLNDDAIFSIALPDMRYCYDKFRRETDAATLIDAWIRRQAIPSPYQLFDFLSRSVDGSGEVGSRAFDIANRFEDAKRHYSDKEALDFVLNSWVTGAYFDVHCSAFTPTGFVKVFGQLNSLGLLNVEISEPVLGHEEFFVKIKKIGSPMVFHPGVVGAGGDKSEYQNIYKDLEHARNAFAEAVIVQDELKEELRLYREMFKWIPSWVRRAWR